MKKIIFLFLFPCTTVLFAQKDTLLKNTLAKLAISDQKVAGLPPEGVSPNSDAWKKFKDSVFTDHYNQAKSIFESKEFPGIDMVGKEGSKHFWLLVQHCDPWPAFQEAVLVAMEKQVILNNASPQDFAYLTDRVRLNTGRYQVYGTQVTYNLDSCQAIPRKLEKPETVNERRKSVGLDSIEEYLNRMGTSHFLMNKADYEQRGILQPKLYSTKSN